MVKQKFPEVETTLAMIVAPKKARRRMRIYMEVYTPLKPKDQWRKGETLESIEEAMQKELSAALPTAVLATRNRTTAHRRGDWRGRDLELKISTVMTWVNWIA
ncbi:hypothetical protein [Rhodanobacter lindaniclasticus]